MPTLSEVLNTKRRELAAVVEMAIRQFEKETGFPVASFTIQHHYANMVLDAETTTVLSVNLNIKEGE